MEDHAANLVRNLHLAHLYPLGVDFLGGNKADSWPTGVVTKAEIIPLALRVWVSVKGESQVESTGEEGLEGQTLTGSTQMHRAASDTALG